MKQGIFQISILKIPFWIEEPVSNATAKIETWPVFSKYLCIGLEKEEGKNFLKNSSSNSFDGKTANFAIFLQEVRKCGFEILSDRVLKYLF